jgi:hypothetical protein
MSTFLSRVAARAVGEQASAKPRPAARFEWAPRSELVEELEQRVSSRPARPPFVPTPPASTARLARTAPPLGARRMAPDQILRGVAAAEPLPERMESPQREVEVVMERLGTVAQPRPARAEETAAAVSPVDASLLARAAPSTGAAPGGAVRQLAAPPAHPSAAEERPETRVHIGRLEVRANLQPAPPPRRREPERAPELSLTDYLRGSRRQ